MLPLMRVLLVLPKSFNRYRVMQNVYTKSRFWAFWTKTHAEVEPQGNFGRLKEGKHVPKSMFKVISSRYSEPVLIKDI